jgi:hypothetical protein
MAVNRIDFEAAVERRCEKFSKVVLAGYAARAEQYAKKNATWKDRTWDARNGLRGDVFYRPGVDMGITLAHTVEYGVHLETANDAKYAILKPTLDHFLPDIKDAAMREFGGKG